MREAQQLLHELEMREKARLAGGVDLQHPNMLREREAKQAEAIALREARHEQAERLRETAVHARASNSRAASQRREELVGRFKDRVEEEEAAINMKWKEELRRQTTSVEHARTTTLERRQEERRLRAEREGKVSERRAEMIAKAHESGSAYLAQQERAELQRKETNERLRQELSARAREEADRRAKAAAEREAKREAKIQTIEAQMERNAARHRQQLEAAQRAALEEARARAEAVEARRAQMAALKAQSGEEDSVAHGRQGERVRSVGGLDDEDKAASEKARRRSSIERGLLNDARQSDARLRREAVQTARVKEVRHHLGRLAVGLACVLGSYSTRALP